MTATVEARPETTPPQFTLRVKLVGKATPEWAEEFLGRANQLMSGPFAWGEVALDADEIVVDKLSPQDPGRSLRLHLVVHLARTDGREPLDGELSSRKQPKPFPLAADGKLEIERHAKELTDSLRMPKMRYRNSTRSIDSADELHF